MRAKRSKPHFALSLPSLCPHFALTLPPLDLKRIQGQAKVKTEGTGISDIGYCMYNYTPHKNDFKENG